MTDVKGVKCKTISRRGNETLLDGKVVYTGDPYGEIQYYPQYIDPFYNPILDKKTNEYVDAFAQEDNFDDFTHAITRAGDPLYTIRGRLQTIFESSEEIKISFVSSDSNYSYNMYNGSMERNVGNNSTSLTENKSVKETHRKIVAIPIDIDHTPYLDMFIGSIEGIYTLSKSYTVQEGYTIVTAPIYGFAILRTAPDSRFYMSFERADNGNFVGQMVRSRLMPRARNATEGESEACLPDGTPVYISYYDPAGSGKRITKQEFDTYMATRAAGVSAYTPLPDVLSGLLGF